MSLSLSDSILRVEEIEYTHITMKLKAYRKKKSTILCQNIVAESGLDLSETVIPESIFIHQFCWLHVQNGGAAKGWRGPRYPVGLHERQSGCAYLSKCFSHGQSKIRTRILTPFIFTYHHMGSQHLGGYCASISQRSQSKPRIQVLRLFCMLAHVGLRLLFKPGSCRRGWIETASDISPGRTYAAFSYAVCEPGELPSSQNSCHFIRQEIFLNNLTQLMQFL